MTTPAYNCTCADAAVPHDHNYAQGCRQPEAHAEPGMILCVEEEHWNDD